MLVAGGTTDPGPALLPAQASCLEAQPEHAATDPVIIWKLFNGACGDRVGHQGEVPGLYRDTWPCAAPHPELPRAAQDRLGVERGKRTFLQGVLSLSLHAVAFGAPPHTRRCPLPGRCGVLMEAPWQGVRELLGQVF